MELKWSLTAKSVCGWHFWAEERSPTYRGWICKFVNAQFTLYLVFVVFTMYKLDPGSISNFTKRIVRIKFPLPQWPPSKYSINYIAEVLLDPLRMIMLLKTSNFKTSWCKKWQFDFLGQTHDWTKKDILRRLCTFEYTVSVLNSKGLDKPALWRLCQLVARTFWIQKLKKCSLSDPLRGAGC